MSSDDVYLIKKFLYFSFLFTFLISLRLTLLRLINNDNE